MSQDWLNGWFYDGTDTMLVGVMVHCVGCGKEFGMTCVFFPEGWKEPGPVPNWAFNQDKCPICDLRARVWGTVPSQPQPEPAQSELFKHVRRLQAQIKALGYEPVG